MDALIWHKSEEKFANVLTLRGHEVHRLKVTGNVLTLKKKLQGVLEGLQQGKAPTEVGAKSIETLDARTIGKAQVSPGNGSLTLQGGEDGAKSLSFSTGDGNADEILREILAQSGKEFRPAQEDIGVVEALLPAVIAGGVGGLLWMGVYQAAGTLASGGDVEVSGRRRGMKRLLAGVAEVLGTTGTIAVGVLLLVLVMGWAYRRLSKRPQRTVWLPESA
ncbi:hypothetical protein [Tautonia plasticadhaerens]|uniref:Uncharacterized protein n=1 Tax=Tautonia plasticadhaerens TaxID=2527974 RepID=A0A518H6X6_9BACT|nr:hypothetical protein [Tautonia plasticadhaerens]QDV36572.1 hypothetical protein ElP_45000 [Tautonia plasticadhaerens]